MAVSVALTRSEAAVTMADPGVGADGGDKSALAIAQPRASSKAGPIVPVLAGLKDPAAQLSASVWVGQATAGQQLFNLAGGAMNRIQITEGQPVTFRARLETEDRTILYRDDVETVLFSLFDPSKTDQATPIHQEDLVVSDVMETALNYGAAWRRDKDGFTFEYTVDGRLLVEGGRVYQVEIVVRTFLDGPITLIGLVETLPIRTAASALGA